MSAMHPFPEASLASANSGAVKAPRRDHSANIGMRWGALHEAAEAVALIAGETFIHTSKQPGDFPTLFQQSDAYARLLVERKIDDLMAVMQPGLSALLSICARGQKPSMAAKTLLGEFERARNEIWSLVSKQQVEDALSPA